jgi:hypothetical protein
MRRSLAALVLTASALAFAPSAQANIVVGKSIAGVKLGDSVATVKRKLGRPQDVLGANKVFEYKRKKLHVEFNKGVVTSLTTFNTHERTSKGVGPGSTLAAVAKAYGADACGVPQHCAIAIGRTSTQFDQGTGRPGRVQAVKVEKLLRHSEID